jgi:acyl-CoA synthetase (AMP-forming)/AMP-acid ligase II
MTPSTCTEAPPLAAAPPATLVHLLRGRAERQPEQLALRFVADHRETAVGYAELDRQARGIAALLQSLQGRGDRTLLVYPPGLEFAPAFLGCLYAGVLPIVVPAPHSARVPHFLSRAAGICRDAGPTVVLTTAGSRDELAGAAALVPALSELHWLATDAVVERPVSAWSDPEPGPDDLAFLQYTSGSTTEPRGVMVSHGNLMANLDAIRARFCQPAGTASVSWLPPHHDMGLVGGILAPLYLGTPATLLSPAAFVQRPSCWLQAISRYGATVSGGPNFAYDLCARRMTPEQCDGLDLSRWIVAFSGAEPIDAGTLRRFAERFAPYGFRADAFMPCYGLAEATLLVSTTPARTPPAIKSFAATELGRHKAVARAEEAADAVALPSCGLPVERVVVADPDTLIECPAGDIGEIWVSGPSVAKGYWSRSDDTAVNFCARLEPLGTTPFLRTGDLGFLLDGDLYVTGRLKDLIIVDGANHYPHDIERTVGEAHPSLSQADCAAFSIPVAGRDAVVVVASPDRHARVAPIELQRAIRAAVARHHELGLHDVVLVRMGQLPKTTSGKIRRSFCRAAYVDRTLDLWEPP